MWENETVQAVTDDVITSRSLDKLKAYLHYHSVYGYQTWQADDLPREASTYNVTPSFGHVVLQDHVTNYKNYISTTAISLATKGVSFHKVTRSFDNVVLWGRINYFSCCITTTTRPMSTKIGKLVACYKKIQPIKSHSSLNMYSHEVTL